MTINPFRRGAPTFPSVSPVRETAVPTKGPQTPVPVGHPDASSFDPVPGTPSVLRDGSEGPEVSALQTQLRDAGFDPGDIDGKFGPQTRAAVTAFQQARGLQVDGVVGPQTRRALGAAAEAPKSSAPEATPKVAGPAAPRGPAAPSSPNAPAAPSSRAGATPGASPQVQALEQRALQLHGPEFLQKVRDISGRLGIRPEWLLSVMQNESGMNPAQRNLGGGAAMGLIQFMPDTARALGTTTDALSRMTAVQQLDFVERFFAPNAGRFQSGADLYLNAFWPAAMGRGDDYNIGGADVARQNRGFDLDRNGQITVGEFRRYYAQRFPELAR